MNVFNIFVTIMIEYDDKVQTIKSPNYFWTIQDMPLKAMLRDFRRVYIIIVLLSRHKYVDINVFYVIN